MTLIQYKRAYISPYKVDEFKKRIRSTLDQKLIFGLITNSGELTNSTFKIKRWGTSGINWVFPTVSGDYSKTDEGTAVNIAIKLSPWTYIMESFALILIVILVANPDTTINGHSSNLFERLSFGIFFMSFWTSILALFSYVLFAIVKSQTESDFDLKQMEKGR